MCVGCPDWIGSCNLVECGARPPVDERTGARRRHYPRHFYLGEVPCQHILAKHEAACPVTVGGPCDYEGRCDER